MVGCLPLPKLTYSGWGGSKTTPLKLKPNASNYRDYNKFFNDRFREYLLFTLSIENFTINCNGLEKFLQVFIKAPNKFAPSKKK